MSQRDSNHSHEKVERQKWWSYKNLEEASGIVPMKLVLNLEERDWMDLVP